MLVITLYERRRKDGSRYETRDMNARLFVKQSLGFLSS